MTKARAGALVDRVRSALSGTPRVVEKRMFGGTLFMVRGRMCVSAGAGRIMCRIDPDRHDAAVKRKGCRTVVMGGRAYRGFVHVDAAVLGRKQALADWVRLALDYNRKAGSGRKKKRTARP